MEQSLIEAFNKKYVIPCFQREYSWTSDEIIELIDNIIELNSRYCLGIVTVKKDNNQTILIDGQQRLTTLYMIAIWCGYIKKQEDINLESEMSFGKNQLYYLLKDNEDKLSNNLLRGWRTIKNEVKTEEDKCKIRNSIEKYLYFYEIDLDESIDINHYFEVMNSRGVQLSRSDIIKSYLMNKFEDSPDNQARLNYMWYIYEKMDATSNSIKNFLNISTKFKSNYLSINEMLEFEEDKKRNDFINNDDDNSVLNFEYFLLYVIRLYNDRNNLPKDYEGEFNLNSMIKEYEDTFKNSSSEKVIDFLNFMIKIKEVYNNYIIKNKGNNDNWEIKKSTKKKMVMLQACLRVSFVNRRVMHWLYMTLGYFYKYKDIDSYIDYMEKYIKDNYVKKYKEFAESLSNKYRTGFDTPIIILNFIDYYIYNNKALIIELIPESKEIDFNKFTFKFRNSIEHFMPRHNQEGELNPDWVHDIGNLALLSYGTNTRMQNAYPEVKAEHFDESGLFEYSLKLQIMSIITKKYGWDENRCNEVTNLVKKIIEELVN